MTSCVLEPSDRNQIEFANIQDRFYTLVGKVNSIIGSVDAKISGTSSADTETQTNDASVVTLTKKRRIKLPETPMLTFDGKYEN